MSTGRDSVLAYLRRQGGELFSADGRGITRRMAASLGYKLGSLGRVLADLEHDGYIEREIRGKRTYRIRLNESQPIPTNPPAVSHGKTTNSVTASEHQPTARDENVLGLLIEIGVLERNFEQMVSNIDRLRGDVEALMARCRERMGTADPVTADPVTIDLRTPSAPARAATNGSRPASRRRATSA